MIFIDNKYTTWYYNIVTKAQSRPIPNTYTEKHHIIPVSLGGTDNDIVVLTAREHYICHILLTKMTKGINRRKMLFALKIMGGGNKKGNKKQQRYTSRLFEYFRPEIAKAASENNKGRLSPMKGKKLSPDDPVRKKMSERAKEPHRRKIQLDNLKKAVEANTGSKRPAEVGKKISAALKNIPKSDAACKNMSIAAKKSNHGAKNVALAYRQTTCIKCKKTMIHSNYQRWHNH